MFRDTRRCFWFGTPDYMQWVPTPLGGADMSPEGWSAGGVLLNGGGYQFNSVGSHKKFIFEWPRSSSVEAAQLMKSYSDGTYGRGHLYFLDPNIYDKNILPARWADPSMALNDEGVSLLAGVRPSALPASGWKEKGLPMTLTSYAVTVPAGWRGREHAVFIPIPQGFRLRLGAVYTRTDTGGVYYAPQNSNGTIGAPVYVNPTSAASASLVNTSVQDVDGIWLYVGRSSTAASSVTLHAMIARLAPIGDPIFPVTRWIGGMGHSGTRFEGKPTYIANNAVDGGQVSFAATFREVGSWAAG